MTSGGKCIRQISARLETKLHLVKNLDFSGLSGKLQDIHSCGKSWIENFQVTFEQYQTLNILDDNETVADDFAVHHLSRYKKGKVVVPEFMESTNDSLLHLHSF